MIINISIEMESGGSANAIIARNSKDKPFYIYRKNKSGGYDSASPLILPHVYYTILNGKPHVDSSSVGMSPDTNNHDTLHVAEGDDTALDDAAFVLRAAFNEVLGVEDSVNLVTITVDRETGTLAIKILKRSA